MVITDDIPTEFLMTQGAIGLAKQEEPDTYYKQHDYDDYVDLPTPMPSQQLMTLKNHAHHGPPYYVPREGSFFAQSCIGFAASAPAGSVNDLLHMYLNLETYCNATGSLFNPYPRYDIDVSLANAIQNPQAICTRTPLDGSRTVLMNLENLKLMWCRMVAHYFEWIQGVPDIYHMNADDRVTLSVHQLCKVVCFTLSFTTYQYNSDGVLFASGIYYPPNPEFYKVQPEIISYIGKLRDVIQNKIIPIFREVGFTYEEYVLLKLLLFFSADTTFLGSDPNDSRTVIREANKRYRHALVEHQKTRYPYMTKQQLGIRMVRMLSVLPYMEVLAELDQSSLAELVVLNKGQLQGELPYDIHVRTTSRR